MITTTIPQPLAPLPRKGVNKHKPQIIGEGEKGSREAHFKAPEALKSHRKPSFLPLMKGV